MKVILYGNQWRTGIRKTVNRSCFRHVSVYERNGKMAIDKFPYTERGIRRTFCPLVPR